MKLQSIIFIGVLAMFAGAEAKNARDCFREARDACKEKKGKERMECIKAANAGDSECRKVMEEGRQKFKAMGAMGEDHPCKVDREKCQESGGGHGAIMKCLYDKRADLSDSCKKHMEGKIASMPCFEDKMKFCKDTEGGRAAHECLKKNKDQVSAACKEKLDKGPKGIDHDM